MERMIIMDRNENNYGPSPKCHEVMRNMTMEYFSTYSRDYPRRIKSRIAEQYGVDPQSVVVGYGAEDLLKQIVHWAVKPSSTIALPDMSWWYYKQIVGEVGATPAEYHMKEMADAWDFDDAEIFSILKKKPRLFIIASPSNPTGNFLTVDRLKSYLEHKDPSTVFVLDEAYWGFGAQSFPEKEVADYGNFILLRTLSKYYALAGLRIGFAFIGKGLEGFATFKSVYLGFNRTSEEMLFGAFDAESNAYYREKAAMIMEDGRMFFDELRAMGFKPYRTCANFILAKLPAEDYALLKEKLPLRGIVIRFLSDTAFQNCIRISIGTREQNHLLVEIMKDLLQRKG
jgi:histidinol-phosphate aminotransferase